MSEHRKCIVCSRNIPKWTGTLYFKEEVQAREEVRGERMGHSYIEQHALEAKPDGTMESTGSLATLYLRAERLPKSKAEAQALTNLKVISVNYLHGRVYSVGTWDGESYRDKYFCTNTCAQKQGYASAMHGARFTWGEN